jgi:DNA (cytosine-5)-methyltransferase 1
MTKLRVLSLFAGIGGFDLGLERTGGFKTVALCEIDPFCRRVLAKHWPEVPCYDDVRTLTAERLAADGISVDVICGGFPCQDISSAGFKVGIGGARSGLWGEYARLIREVRPRFVVVENVAAVLSRGLDRILGDLAEIRYDAEWDGLPASAIGAHHDRDRLWLVASPDSYGQPACPQHDEACRLPADGDASHAQRRVVPLGVHLARARREQQSLSWNRVWPGQDSPMGMGVDDGIPERLDRLRSLGNSVVPQITELIGNAILASMQKQEAA